MPYCAQSHLESRYGYQELVQLTDRLNYGRIDVAVLNAALADATALMDSYFETGGYTVPLNPVPPIVLHRAAQLTRCMLYEDGKPADIEATCKAVMAWLETVASGKVRLPGLTPIDSVSDVAAGSRTLLYSDELWEEYDTWDSA